MGFRSAILEKSKTKSQTSSSLPASASHHQHLHNPFHHIHNQNANAASTDSSSTSTPRRSQGSEPDPDSYEAFLLRAERDERERLEVIELESRIRRRAESWGQEKRSKDGGTRAWLIGNGLSK